MAEYYKYIEPGFRAVRPYKLYKTWMFHTSSFTPFSSTGELNIYNAISPLSTDVKNNSDGASYNSQIIDVHNYPIGDVYALRDGTWYIPISESDVPYNYPNGYVARYSGGETRYLDNMYQGAYSGSVEIMGHVAKNLWHSIYHLFYRKGGDFRGDGPGALYEDDFIEKASIESSSVLFFNIPQQKFGESILKESFELLMVSTQSVDVPYSSSGNASVNIDIVDDGNGNLFDAQCTVRHSGSMSSSIGNISYDKGLIFVTDSEYYRYMSSSFFVNANTGSVSMDFAYTSYYTAYEHEYICVVKAHEFNRTSNITAYGPAAINDNDQVRFLFEDAIDQSGSAVNFRPLATGVGLYDNTNNLIAVGKFAKPIRIENDLDSVFIVRFDF